MDSPRSLAIFVAIILLAIFYTDIVRWIHPEPRPANIEQSNTGAPSGVNPTAEAAGAGANQGPAAVGNTIANASVSPVGGAAQMPAGFTPRDIVVDTDLYTATFTTAGAPPQNEPRPSSSALRTAGNNPRDSPHRRRR